jgi:hypothetical protein
MKKAFFTFVTIIASYQTYAQDGAFSNVSINYNNPNGQGLIIYNSNSSAYSTLQVNGSTGYSVPKWANSMVFESVPVSNGGFVLSSYTGDITFQTNNRSNRMTITSNGNIGIGTTSPSQPLTVPITSNSGGISLGTYASLSAGQFAFIGVTGADGTFNGGNLSSTDNGSAGMAIVHTNGGLGNSTELAFVTHNNGHDSRERLRIDRLGNIGIGTTIPSEKLSVNGKIRAQEIKVENTNWPDYVFDETYQLTTLQETEKYIKEEGHLPGIPSAAEVKANGIDLGEMNAKLLQKIEELTLHLIERDSVLTLQKDALRKQQLQLTKQQEQINSIMKKLK